MSKEKCCGNCKHSYNEGTDGVGLCDKDDWLSKCDEVCEHHEPHESPAGWTEITPDNVDGLYNIQVNRLVIAWNQEEMTICRMYHDISPLLPAMATLGGYYYMELPELNYGTK